MNLNFLKLAMQAGIPLVWVRTDDPVFVERVLTHMNDDKEVVQLTLPPKIEKSEEFAAKLKAIQEPVLYTSSECASIVKLWKICLETEKTIVFVNCERNPIMLDGGVLLPPMALVETFMTELLNPEEDEDLKDSTAETIKDVLPTLGGMTLKDVLEVCRMTMTRDEALTARGVNETRRGYSHLTGISQVDTNSEFYVEDPTLAAWLEENGDFFKNPVHADLVPRGLLLDGPPGTGKTEGGKEIARQFGMPLYRLDLGAMMGKYVGDSEGNLNAALAQLDEVAPCVALLDEVEKVFQSSSDSGVTSRMLSQLLWWLQEHESRVFTVMTTNKAGAIPEELWRAGRIDAKMDFYGIKSKQAASDFAATLYTKILGKLGHKPVEKTLVELKKQAGNLVTENGTASQAKLTVLAQTMAKKTIKASNSGNETVH